MLIWNEIIKESKIGFDRVYKILDVRFDEIVGQSKFSNKGKKVISEAIKKKLVIKENDGAVYVDFQNEKIPKKYILRSNGTASYITQDIGAAVERYEKYNFDKMIYVTDYRQELHFQQLFEILNKFGYSFYSKCIHVPFGTVNFGKEIMATRVGKIILLEDLLKKTIEKAHDEIKKRKTKGDATKIGVGAIKYIILRNEPIKDVEFSWKSALNFEGDSGPYLQYAHTRCSGILRKSKNLKLSYSIKQLTDQEKRLLKMLSMFPETVEQAAINLKPSQICNYVYDLATSFNEFYEKCPVIKAEKELKNFRLTLVNATAIVLKNALNLIGIEAVDKM
jgi:arginyl-tRNA synthetase